MNPVENKRSHAVTDFSVPAPNVAPFSSRKLTVTVDLDGSIRKPPRSPLSV